MLAVAHFCCSEYGWPWEYVVEDARLLPLVLLMREKAHQSSEGGDGFTLQEQQMLDEQASLPWEEQVQRSRERLFGKGN